MSASLKGFKASLQLQAAITKIQKIEQMSNTKELFSAPVPELGIELPHIFKLGLTFAYQVGFSTKVSGTATVIFGATASIPDDAVVTVDLNNPHKSSWTGFEGADVSPVFDVTGLSANVKFAVFSQADLAFGIDLHDKARFDVELNLKIPQLSTTISAGYSMFPPPLPLFPSPHPSPNKKGNMQLTLPFPLPQRRQVGAPRKTVRPRPAPASSRRSASSCGSKSWPNGGTRRRYPTRTSSSTSQRRWTSTAWSCPSRTSPLTRPRPKRSSWHCPRI